MKYTSTHEDYFSSLNKVSAILMKQWQKVVLSQNYYCEAKV